MEILAHASAPSSRKDDERFKRQALAYSTFKAASSISVLHNEQVSSSKEATRKEGEVNTKTPARTVIDPAFYLDNTQLAYSALESQLITSSLGSIDNDEDEYKEDEDEEVTPRPARNVPDVLPPNESSDTGEPSSSRKIQPSLVPISSHSHGQGNLLSSPSARLRARQDLTLGYIGGISTADVWATPSRPLPQVPQGVPQPHQPDVSSSSPGDDLPSQLPSTYSLSDISSDKGSNHGAIERLMSSPWVNLPRGTASEKGSVEVDSDSNHNADEELTSSPWEDLPRGTVPEINSTKETSSGEGVSSSRSRRANISAPVQASSSRNGVSSYSLDRACIPLPKGPQGKLQKVSFPRSKGDPSSQYRAKGLQKQSRDQRWLTPGVIMSSPSTNLPDSSPPIDIPGTSSPAPLSPTNGVLEEAHQDPERSHFTPAHPSVASKSGLHLPSSVPSNVPPSSSTPLPKPLPQALSSVPSRIPETNLASKKRRYTDFSTPKSNPKPEELSKLKTLSTVIRPDPPATSSEPFVTHITPYLHEKYFSKPELENRYLPSHVTRELRPSERGYWVVDPSPWALELQLRFWNFLEKQIGSGKAGWGVWCVRGEDEDEVEVAVGGQQEVDLGTVKIFCWGEVVGHVYLLLYVASGSKVRKVEPCWVDAGGEVVVRI